MSDMGKAPSRCKVSNCNIIDTDLILISLSSYRTSIYNYVYMDMDIYTCIYMPVLFADKYYTSSGALHFTCTWAYTIKTVALSIDKKT